MKQLLLAVVFVVACGNPDQAPVVDVVLFECPPEDLQLLEATEVLLRERIAELEALQLPKALKAASAAISADLAASKLVNGPKDPDNVWRRRRAHGVLLARMFVSEDSRAIRRVVGGGTEGELTNDHRNIMVTVYNHRQSKKSFRGWIDVMSFLSPHVGRLKVAKPHTRQRWTSRLPATGDAPDPGRGWVDCMELAEGDDDCDGDWRIHGPLWVKLREATVRTWLTADFEAIMKRSKKKPRKWGNKEDVIRFLARHPDHLCVLDTPTKNFFLARPGDGCELGDPATVAAREGKKLARDGS